jgi:Fic family protein
MSVVHYALPDRWINYNKDAVFQELTEAKAAVMVLQTIPFQRRWVEELQKIQLKMEVAGTSKIEGADFTGNELDAAIRAETPEQLLTRSQKQANAAVRTYRWIAKIPDDRPLNGDLMSEIHRSIVTDCDDDHCAPGKLRSADQNVTFGMPRHRGVNGGDECRAAFDQLSNELQTSFREHDLLIQALALHYHFGAIHPFADGNGRTARALEALMLQRAGLRDSLFIAMSNFYYDEKREYLASLAQSRAANHDLTAFLKFGLRGIAVQSARLASAIKTEVSKQIFRNLMHDLFTRLENTRKRVIVKRQLSLLEKLLNTDKRIEFFQLSTLVRNDYASRSDPESALVRDLNRLHALGAIRIEKETDAAGENTYYIGVRLDWPSKITDTEVFAKLAQLPKSKTYGFLSSDES